MPKIDLSLEELLCTARPHAPARFRCFWARTLDESARTALAAEVQPSTIRCEVITSTRCSTPAGAARAFVAGTSCPLGPAPSRRSSSITARGQQGDDLQSPPMVAAGYAVFAVDTRGQTGDSSNPALFGRVLSRLYDARHPRCRRVLLSRCVRRLRACARFRMQPARSGRQPHRPDRHQPGWRTDAGRGGSGPPAKAAMPRVPFLCHYQRALEISDKHPTGRSPST